MFLHPTILGICYSRFAERIAFLIADGSKEQINYYSVLFLDYFFSNEGFFAGDIVMETRQCQYKGGQYGFPHPRGMKKSSINVQWRTWSVRQCTIYKQHLTVKEAVTNKNWK